MSLYAISDLHLSLSTSKSMDIFSGWNDYVSKIEKNWSSVVKESDTVVIAGDISWAMSLEETKEDFAFINQLPGKKIFVKGNHDYWWTTRSKMEKFLSENLFTSISILFNSSVSLENVCVCGAKGWIDDGSLEENSKIKRREALRLKTSIEQAENVGKEPVVFLHYPPVYCGNECSEIMNVLVQKKIKRCFYGHIHGSNAHLKAVNGLYKGIDFKLISCDYLNFTPYFVL